MAKRYTEELAEWVKQRAATRPRQDKSLVAFLAVREDIHEAIDAGYALKTIWEHLHEKGKISYRYETFLKHVNKHIKGKKVHLTAPAKQPTSDRPLAATTQKTQSKVREAVIEKPKTDGFSFNATPKKEELL